LGLQDIARTGAKYRSVAAAQDQLAELYDGEAARLGSDEVVFLNERGEVTEGVRSNIFVERDGVLLTPPLTAGVPNGRLRAELITAGKAREATLFPEDLAKGLFFGNSLRGLIAGLPAKGD
jgi:para-aminobenzoate synthetase/4-amino-4-deoxychorismate lyase